MSSRVVDAPPTFPTLNGGCLGKQSPLPLLGLGRTEGNISPMWKMHFPKRGTSEPPPHKQGEAWALFPPQILCLTTHEDRKKKQNKG